MSGSRLARTGNGPLGAAADDTRGPIGRWLALAASVAALDQLTKVAVVRNFAFAERRPVIEGGFDLTLVYNKGAAFSFLASASGWQRWFFVAVGVAASLLIIWLLMKHAGQRTFAAGLALILGGAIGNVIDRVLYGHVVDFLLVHWNDRWYFPAFNLADSSITVGAALLIWDELRRMFRGG